MSRPANGWGTENLMEDKIGLLGPLPSQWTSKWTEMKQKALEARKAMSSSEENALDTEEEVSSSEEEAFDTGEDICSSDEESVDTGEEGYSSEEEVEMRTLEKALGNNRDPTWHALIPIIKGLAAFWPSDRMSLKDAMIGLQQVSEKYHETINNDPELEQWRSSLEEPRYREAGSSIKEPWYHNPDVWESLGITEFPEAWKSTPSERSFESEDELRSSGGSILNLAEIAASQDRSEY